MMHEGKKTGRLEIRRSEDKKSRRLEEQKVRR